uniref:uncharacterized protein LOC120332703 n=1 Tax=Styela clava TaxID=7725 RepID=UPI00193A9C56|nr:uncharacterized protein LOC120332703 [Styela clava]
MKILFFVFLSVTFQLSYAHSSCPVEGSVEYMNKCFWVTMAPTSAGVNYDNAKKLCEEKNANPANIYSESHYNSIMAYLRKARGDFYYVYLGMKYDKSKLKNYDGSAALYVKWRSGDPITVVAAMVPMTQVAIDIFPDQTNGGNGMLTSYEGWKKKGVVCEAPVIETSASVCLQDDQHFTRGDQCFYVKMSPTSHGVNYAEAEKLCLDDNAFPANIYDAKHYDDTMNHLRTTNHKFHYVYLGMDYTNKNLKYYDGSKASYAHWRSGDPVTVVASGESMDRVAIDVFPDASYVGNGMLTSAANWGKNGVICEEYTKRCVDQANHILHGDSCFWVEMTQKTPGINYEEAEKLCRVKQGTPANIYDAEHYSNAMSLLREANNMYYFVYLGMSYKNEKLTYYDGSSASYANWRYGDPVTAVASGEPMIQVAIDVYPESSNSGNGMLTSAPNWEKKGVLCEQKTHRCLNHEHHLTRKSSCFWVEMAPKSMDPGANFEEAEKLCRDKEGTPANIYDAEHYSDTMSLLRKVHKSYYFVYLGMDYENQKLKYYDGSPAPYAKWRNGDPVTTVASREPMIKVAIDVYPEEYNSGNGMLTSAPNWEKKGVVCEQKINPCHGLDKYFMWGDKCFWVDMANESGMFVGYNFAESEKACASKQGTPANIYDAEHYAKTMSHLREVKDEFYYVYLGMDHKGGNLKYYDGSTASYAHWRPGDPRPTMRDDEPMDKVAIDVHPNPSDPRNGMLTSVHSWEKKGVVCER